MHLKLPEFASGCYERHYMSAVSPAVDSASPWNFLQVVPTKLCQKANKEIPTQKKVSFGVYLQPPSAHPHRPSKSSCITDMYNLPQQTIQLIYISLGMLLVPSKKLIN